MKNTFRKAKFVTVICLLCISVTARAGSLVVEFKEKSKTSVSFYLSDKPKYWISGQTLKISSDEIVSEFAISDVDYVHFNNELTKVNNDFTSPKISVFPNPTTDYIEIKNYNTSSNIILKDFAGKTLKSYQTNKDGITIIDVKDIPAGTYILTIDSETIKFIKK